MNEEFLFRQIVSVAGVSILIALAWWAKIPRKLEPLDPARARALLADEFPKAAIEQIWLADDGRGALAKAGEEALVLSAMGDGYVARATPWSAVADTTPEKGRLSIRVKDFAAPRITLAMAHWPKEARA